MDEEHRHPQGPQNKAANPPGWKKLVEMVWLSAQNACVLGIREENLGKTWDDCAYISQPAMRPLEFPWSWLNWLGRVVAFKLS